MQQLNSTLIYKTRALESVIMFEFFHREKHLGAPDTENRTGALKSTHMNGDFFSLWGFSFSPPFFTMSSKLEAEARSCSRCSLICGGQMETCVLEIIITLWKPSTGHWSGALQLHFPLQKSKQQQQNLSWDKKQMFDLVASQLRGDAGLFITFKY